MPKVGIVPLLLEMLINLSRFEFKLFKNSLMARYWLFLCFFGSILSTSSLTQPFEQKVQSISIAKYKENALNFAQNYKYRTSPLGVSQESKREHEYWNLVTKPECTSNSIKLLPKRYQLSMELTYPLQPMAVDFLPAKFIIGWTRTSNIKLIFSI